MPPAISVGGNFNKAEGVYRSCLDFGGVVQQLRLLCVFLSVQSSSIKVTNFIFDSLILFLFAVPM